MRLLCIRHGTGPDDDRVVSWCRLNGVNPDIRHPHLGQDAGDITEDVAGVVVYGGKYNADSSQENPFLRDEYRLMRDALKADIPLLGICQGAQMLAMELGAWAGAPEHGSHEFGYYEVSPTEAGKAFLPEPHVFCQAHFHTFDIPAGATHLARSDIFENQAFSYGKAVALQYHAENTIEGFRRWQKASWSFGKPGAQDFATQEDQMMSHDRRQADWFYDFMDRTFGGNERDAN